jgi:hypothetical protein
MPHPGGFWKGLIMAFRKGLLASLALAAVLFADAVHAGIQQPHPVFAWNGNQYLFEVKRVGGTTYLTGYRALGQKWRLVGTTQIREGQQAADQSFLQRIWFHGQKIGTVVADLNDPWWRYYPGEDTTPE